MIRRIGTEAFDRVYALLEKSFPREEYRPYAGQKALFSDPAYRVYGYSETEGGEILGILAVWELKEFLFLEHFAVEPARRNGGIGSRFLRELLEQWEKPAVLEVELPENEIAARRIGFYERCGFTLNRYPYEQPSLGPGRGAVPLWLMTSCGPLSPEAFPILRDEIYRRVYKIQ